ncbi:MAG TPA: hypothetical protein VEA41_15365 [Salinarimonas sp.]|nr:hypothetical protein [Salinarimonas sp.]
MTLPRILRAALLAAVLAAPASAAAPVRSGVALDGFQRAFDAAARRHGVGLSLAREDCGHAVMTACVFRLGGTITIFARAPSLAGEIDDLLLERRAGAGPSLKATASILVEVFELRRPAGERKAMIERLLAGTATPGKLARVDGTTVGFGLLVDAERGETSVSVGEKLRP